MMAVYLTGVQFEVSGDLVNTRKLDDGTHSTSTGLHTNKGIQPRRHVRQHSTLIHIV